MKNIVYTFILFALVIGCTTKQEMQSMSNESSMISDDINQTITNLYDAIGHDGDDHPDWEMFQSVFVEGANLMDVKDTTLYRYTIEEYIDAYRTDVEAGNYSFITEYELTNTGDVYANIAQVFSTYAATIVPTDSDTLKKRGINSIQLMRGDGMWKITSIIWYDETDKYPIPDRYLNDM